jgi:hypothetical protein
VLNGNPHAAAVQGLRLRIVLARDAQANLENLLMKSFLTTLLLSTAMATAGAAYAAGPSGTPGSTLPPSTTPTDTDDTTNTPGKPMPSGQTAPDTSNSSSTHRSNSDMDSHHSMDMRHGSHMRSASTHVYSQQCRELREQWQDASERHMHSRHFKSAKHQAALGERSCRSHKTGMLKSGVVHLKSALRMIGEKPSI